MEGPSPTSNKTVDPSSALSPALGDWARTFPASAAELSRSRTSALKPEASSSCLARSSVRPFTEGTSTPAARSGEEPCSPRLCERAQAMPPRRTRKARVATRIQGVLSPLSCDAAGSGTVARAATLVGPASSPGGLALIGGSPSRSRRRSSASCAALSYLPSGSFASSFVVRAFSSSGISGFKSLGGRNGALTCFMDTATGFSAV